MAIFIYLASILGLGAIWVDDRAARTRHPDPGAHAAAEVATAATLLIESVQLAQEAHRLDYRKALAGRMPSG